MSTSKFNPKSPYIAFDTEATGLNPWGTFKRWGFYPARPFAFSLCDMEGETKFFRWKVDPFTRQVFPVSRDLDYLQKLFSNPKLKVVGHNIGYDIRMAEGFKLKFKCQIHDSLILTHVVTGGGELQYGLKFLGQKYLDMNVEDEDELQDDTVRARNQGKKLGWCLAQKETHGREPIKADYWMAKPELLERYAVLDAVRAMMLFLLGKEQMEEDENFQKTYEMEMSLFRHVKAMEDRGTRVFPEEIKRLEKFYMDYMAEQIKLANANGGKGMNFRSSKQKVNVFYVQRKYEPTKFTKAGNPSVDGEVLQDIETRYKDPLARAILEYNGAAHALSAFLNPYKNFMVEDEPGTWVLHPNYKQCGPVTGRFACSDPNLMQVAAEDTGRRKTLITLKPREAFGPRNKCLWYLPDYSQIEVWLFSFLSQEQAMIQALLSGRDFHGEIARQLWGNAPDYEEKKKYYRKRAKLIMFCKLYGGGVKKVAFLLEEDISVAAKFVYQYDNAFPGVQRFMRRMINRAGTSGKVVNPFGRTQFIDIGFAYRAVNYLIQGTAADIMKRAMIRLGELFESKWKGVYMLLTIHDELAIEVPYRFHSKRLMRDIIACMQADSQQAGIPVPLPVSMKISKQFWSKTIDIKKV